MKSQKAFQCAVLLLASAAILSGCGRKGPLEPPPSSYIVNDKGQSVEKPKENKPIFLDKLIP